MQTTTAFDCQQQQLQNTQNFIEWLNVNESHPKLSIMNMFPKVFYFHLAFMAKDLLWSRKRKY